ncbi:MAG: hypothetical protein IPN90_12345 [Elusimicrobia bacterium]|nr:hypothetical protein [Elusimicrobiota bacterium]
MRDRAPFHSGFRRQGGGVAILLVVFLLLVLLPLGLVLVRAVGVSWRRGTETRTWAQNRYRVETALEVARNRMAAGTDPQIPSVFTAGHSGTFPIIVNGKTVQVTVTHVILRDNN